MEQIANLVLIYLIGWALGFLTCTGLVWHIVNRPVRQERTAVKDLYPEQK